MYIIKEKPNANGSRPPIQTWGQPNLPNDYAEFPADFLEVYSQYNGFVNILVEGGKCVDCQPNMDAWEKWREENPPEPEPTPMPTIEERMDAMESAMLAMMGV